MSKIGIALGAVLMGVWARRSQRLAGWRAKFAEDSSVNGAQVYIGGDDQG